MNALHSISFYHVPNLMQLLASHRIWRWTYENYCHQKQQHADVLCSRELRCFISEISLVAKWTMHWMSRERHKGRNRKKLSKRWQRTKHIFKTPFGGVFLPQKVCFRLKEWLLITTGTQVFTQWNSLELSGSVFCGHCKWGAEPFWIDPEWFSDNCSRTIL